MSGAAALVADRLAEQLGGLPHEYETCARAVVEDIGDALAHLDPIEVALRGLDPVLELLRGEQ